MLITDVKENLKHHKSQKRTILIHLKSEIKSQKQEKKKNN